MATAVPVNTDLIRDARQALVYVRENWEDAWTAVPHLFASWVSWAANPSVAAAQLEWRYGIGMRQMETEFTPIPRKTLDNWFVKIAVVQNDASTIVWYGVILENIYSPHGSNLYAYGQRTPLGHQGLLAYGLEVLLDREPITTSVYKDQNGDPVRIGRALEVNRKDKHKNHGEQTDSGNMSEEPDEATGVCVFAGDPAASTTWNTRELVHYLLTYHAPGVAINGTPDISWEIDSAAEVYLPTWDKPHVAMQGRTVKEVLDSVLDRRRLLGYCVEVLPGEEGSSGEGIDKAIIRPFQYTDQAITFTDGVLGPNADQKTFDFDTMPDVGRVTVQRSVSHKYDAIVARGERVLCCGTFSALDGTLTKGWTSDQESAYCTGASGATDYASLEPYQKSMRNAQARASDKFERVFSHFVVPPGWGGNVLGGEVNETVALFPYTDLSVTESELSAWFYPEMRFEHYLPIKTDHDYSALKIYDSGIVDSTPDGMQWEYLRPLVCIKLPPVAGQSGTRYGQVEKLSAAASVETMGEGAGMFHAYGVRVNPESPGICLHVSGAPAHALATNDFLPVDDSDTYAGELDWHENLLATLAVRADYYLQKRYPASGDASRILTIDVGDKAEAHYVAAGTVVGIIDGTLIRSTSGGFVRDDRELLSDVARAAYEWYGQERQTLAMVWGQADRLGLRIGDLIVEIGGFETTESVRTVVTELRLQFAGSENDRESCTLQTHWGELDVLRMI